MCLGTVHNAVGLLNCRFQEMAHGGTCVDGLRTLLMFASDIPFKVSHLLCDESELSELFPDDEAVASRVTHLTPLEFRYRCYYLSQQRSSSAFAWLSVAASISVSIWLSVAASSSASVWLSVAASSSVSVWLSVAVAQQQQYTQYTCELQALFTVDGEWDCQVEHDSANGTAKRDTFKALIGGSMVTRSDREGEYNTVEYDSTTRTLKLIYEVMDTAVAQYEVMDTAVAHWDSSKKCVTMVWGNGELWTKKPKVQG